MGVGVREEDEESAVTAIKLRGARGSAEAGNIPPERSEKEEEKESKQKTMKSSSSCDC